jgi:hypothetical protein
MVCATMEMAPTAPPGTARCAQRKHSAPDGGSRTSYGAHRAHLAGRVQDAHLAHLHASQTAFERRPGAVPCGTDGSNPRAAHNRQHQPRTPLGAARDFRRKHAEPGRASKSHSSEQ